MESTNFEMDWNKEIQDLILDLQTAALAVELFRLALFQSGPLPDHFSLEVRQEYLFRCGALLSQRAADLDTWGQSLVPPAAVSAPRPTAPG